MQSPLDRILDWYTSLPHDTQIMMSTFSFGLHYDENIGLEEDDEKRNKKLCDYMDSSDLRGGEIITRTLFLINLFDFGLVNRDTEQAWDRMMDMQLDYKNSLKERRMSTIDVDENLSTWQAQKYHWIGISNLWKELKEQHLNFSQLNRYYGLYLIRSATQ